MSSRKATESFCFIHTTQHIYEEDNKNALEHLGRQATFKFRALWSIKDGKGLNYGYDLPGLTNAMDTTNSLQFICWVKNGFYQ